MIVLLDIIFCCCCCCCCIYCCHIACCTINKKYKLLKQIKTETDLIAYVCVSYTVHTKRVCIWLSTAKIWHSLYVWHGCCKENKIMMDMMIVQWVSYAIWAVKQRVRNLTYFFQIMLILWIVTLSSCLI